MSMLRLIVPGADYSATSVGFFGGLDLPHSPYASYLLGSQFGSEVRDQSGNNRHTAQVGTPTRNTYYATLSDANCFEVPFNGDTLSAAGGTNALTFIGIGKAASGVQWHLASSFDNGTSRSASLSLNGNGLKAYANPAGGASALSTSPTDAARADRLTFGASVLTSTNVQLFERWSGSALQTYAAAPIAAQNPVGGTLNFRLGGDYTSAAFNGTGDLFAAAFYPRALNTTEIDAVYTAFDTFLARFGITL